MKSSSANAHNLSLLDLKSTRKHFLYICSSYTILKSAPSTDKNKNKDKQKQKNKWHSVTPN